MPRPKPAIPLISTVAAAAAVVASLATGATPVRPGGNLAEPPPSHPNVLVILVDDLGWKDLGVTGSQFYETPNIDRLAAEGTRFAQFYSAGAVCSPTRASLMTGKSPARLHMTDWIGASADPRAATPSATYERQLPLAEHTVAEAFADAGYDTGYIGKWHLGSEGSMPAQHGFAWSRAVNGAGQPTSHIAPYAREPAKRTDVPDLGDAPPGEYLTDRLTTEAIRFMQTPREKPFFLVLSHYAVHTPIQAPKEVVDRYAAKKAAALGRESHADSSATYAAMIERLDLGVGRLLECLDSLHIADRTLVVFTSD
ncbi:MAG: sulfatase-like hydrolase/transferase, partial [Phycisphaerae bacterium]|nr:sulfatase-like hydrolase/transferase [Phycisphaerae bacterium]